MAIQCHLEYKGDLTGIWKSVRCECCREITVFRTIKAARERIKKEKLKKFRIVHLGCMCFECSGFGRYRYLDGEEL